MGLKSAESSTSHRVATNWFLFLAGLVYVAFVPLGSVLAFFLGGLAPRWYMVAISAVTYPVSVLEGVIRGSPWTILILSVYLVLPNIIIAYLLFRRKSGVLGTMMSIIAFSGALVILGFIFFAMALVNPN